MDCRNWFIWHGIRNKSRVCYIIQFLEMHRTELSAAGARVASKDRPKSKVKACLESSRAMIFKWTGGSVDIKWTSKGALLLLHARTLHATRFKLVKVDRILITREQPFISLVWLPCHQLSWPSHKYGKWNLEEGKTTPTTLTGLPMDSLGCINHPTENRLCEGHYTGLIHDF